MHIYLIYIYVTRHCVNYFIQKTVVEWSCCGHCVVVVEKPYPLVTTLRTWWLLHQSSLDGHVEFRNKSWNLLAVCTHFASAPRSLYRFRTTFYEMSITKVYTGTICKLFLHFCTPIYYETVLRVWLSSTELRRCVTRGFSVDTMNVNGNLIVRTKRRFCCVVNLVCTIVGDPGLVWLDWVVITGVFIGLKNVSCQGDSVSNV